MAWDFINVSAGTILPSTINNYTPNVSALGSFTWSGRTSNIADVGTDIKSIATSTETLYTTNRFGVSLSTLGNGILVKLFLDNTSISSISMSGNYGVDNAWLTFVINDETEQANCLYTWYDSNDSPSRAYQTRSAFNNASQQATLSHNLYLALKSAIIPEYTWKSVQSITGKNKTVSLTTLKEESINDGSPVNDASASAFNNAPDSCSVGGIISAILPIIEGDPTSVAIKYNIPSPIDSTYTSVKLVAKKKKIPKSKTDGDKIIDISPSSGSVTVNNLDEQTKYYFAIFVEDNFGNKADSEPKDITTGEKPKKWKETISYLKMITG